MLLTGHAVAQNYVFVVFQAQTTKHNSHDYVIRQVKGTIVMKNLTPFRTNVSYRAYISDCMIEICKTNTITFGYQTHFFSQSTFKLQLHWLFTVSIRPRSDDGKHRNKVAPLNIDFSSSRNAALIEREMLQYTALSIKTHHSTLSEIKTQIYTMSDILACVSVYCADQRKHSISDFLTKNIDNTLQTCVDIANEYLQAYNTGADLRNHLFCSLH